DLSEDDMLSLEKGVEDIFIKDNLEKNQMEASNSQHNADQQPAAAESAKNSDLPKEW
ncbi:hypothetical protein U1Q18_043049, partial [Sarracenia purpurea var. burkii]